MIFGHEGQPRSGKSYEAVLYHILPALSAGRHVFFRLNGVMDCIDNIGAHLTMAPDEVRALLHPMGNDEVHNWLVCDSANDGTLTFPHIPMHALIVIDEVHEYFPVGRSALPERTANFFAKHGHLSLDVVLMTQDFKEVHRSVFRRIAKKNFYAKLDALGKDQSYSVRFYVSPSPGKFELIGSEKRNYDPVVWTMYHGIQPGVEGNAVYKANSRTLWQTAKKPAIAVGLALVIGVGLIVRFFTGHGIVPETKPRKAAMTQPAFASNQGEAVPGAAVAAPGGPVRQGIAATAKPAIAKPAPIVEKVYPAGIAYLRDLLKDARPRFGGAIGHRLILEVRQPGGGQVMERMTSDQLKALGWVVDAKPYGALVSYRDLAYVFTAWPVDLPGQQSQQTAENIRNAGGPVASASEPLARTAAVGAGIGAAGDLVQPAGGMRGYVGKAPEFKGGAD